MRPTYEYRTVVTPEEQGFDITKDTLLTDQGYELYLPIMRSKVIGEGFIYYWRKRIDLHIHTGTCYLCTG